MKSHLSQALRAPQKTVDSEEPKGVSESAILHNEEAYALYREHADRKRRSPRQRSPNGRTHVAPDNHLGVNVDRDLGRVRQRYLQATKADLVDRLLVAEQAYADMEARWLSTADELLAWIMVADRLLAGQDSGSTGRL